MCLNREMFPRVHYAMLQDSQLWRPTLTVQSLCYERAKDCFETKSSINVCPKLDKPLVLGNHYPADWWSSLTF